MTAALPDTAFTDRMAEVADAVNHTLDRLLGDAPLAGETVRPDRLLEAMRYAALAGGKRFRPLLVVETARLFGAEGEGPMRAAAALECVHCYSLVHDDLPAMDDDDMRRGRPTVHRAFDEATAILAGDALLTYAFDILADPATHPDPAIRCRLVAGLARAAGLGGMAGGQMLDLQGEGQALEEADIRTLQAMKTGALIAHAAEAGAIVGGADEADCARMRRFGAVVGLAFQLADDLLDHEGEADAVGKKTGKDAEIGKATLVALNGADWTRKTLSGLVDEAGEILVPFGVRAELLRKAAEFVASRRS